ncbi:hypothetical protein ZWY2020_025032 [Hordeum vulgare]|nr:hypothetical protein ZWY2020_025032 [Hordeum vulgare]
MELVASCPFCTARPCSTTHGVAPSAPSFCHSEPVRNRAVDVAAPWPWSQAPPRHGHCLEHLPSAANARALASSSMPPSSPSLCFLYSSQKSRAARTLCVDRAKTSPPKPAF